MLAKVGDVVDIKIKKPNKNEFRGVIGNAVDVFLVFKGQTKIGMIPINIDTSNLDLKKNRNGKIEDMNLITKKIIIKISN